MKLFNVFVCCLTLFCVSTLSAQNSKINILKLGGSIFTITDEGESESLFGGALSLEHQLGKKSSFNFNLDFNAKSESVTDGNFNLESKLSILTLEPEYRWYAKSATDGFFLGLAPSIHIINASVTFGNSEVTDDETRFGGSLKIGYQIKFTPKFNVQFGTGGGLLLPSGDTFAVLRFNFNLLAGYQF